MEKTCGDEVTMAKKKKTPSMPSPKKQRITIPDKNEEGIIMQGLARKILQGDASRYDTDDDFRNASPYEMARRIINDNEGISVAEAMLDAYAMRAIYFGDVNCGAFIRDTAGEKPREKTEVDNKIEVSFKMSLTGSEAPELPENNPIELSADSISEVDDAET